MYDHEEFRIDSSLLVEPQWTHMSAALKAAVALVALCTAWIWIPLVLAGLFWTTVLALVFGKSFTRHTAALLLPPIMGQIDQRFARVRQELLKNLTGRVLDVGAGAGAYFKVCSHAAPTRST